jgi:hypothetical protein
MQQAWVEAILQQCETAQIPFFFKQWGGVRKHKAGRQLHGRTYDAQPSRMAIAVSDQTTRQEALARAETWSVTWQTVAKEALDDTALRPPPSSQAHHALSLTAASVA